MNELTNDQIKEKKSELKKQIEQLNDKTSNPESYRTSEHGPYVNTPKHEADKEKLSQLLIEYGKLIVSRDVGSATLKKSLSFTNGMYTLKYTPEKNRWDFYIGQEYKTSDVRFSEDGEEAKVHVPTCNSDTHAELEDYVYSFRTASSPDLIVEKAQAIPCSKVIEGLSAQPCTDKEYMAKMGYFWDETYKKYRKQIPEEYEQKQKADPKYQAPKKKEEKKRGLLFSSFLSKSGNKK